MGFIPPTSTPLLLELTDGFYTLKKVCKGETDFSSLGQRLIKLHMMSFDERGGSMEELRELIQMLKLLVDAFRPIYQSPGFPRNLAVLLRDLSVLKNKMEDGIKDRGVYRTMMEFYLMLPIQKLAVGEVLFRDHP